MVYDSLAVDLLPSVVLKGERVLKAFAPLW